MQTLPTIAAVVLIALGGSMAFMNGLVLLQSYRGTRQRSSVPLIGAFLLGAGLRILPATHNVFWLAVFDPGTLLLVVGSPTLVREIWIKKARVRR